MDDISNHDEKVESITNFLHDDPAVVIHVLLVIGDPLTGKKTALEKALETVCPNRLPGWNIMVWHHGKIPSYYQFTHIDNPSKWIILRYDTDDHALLTHGLLEEWIDNPDAMLELVSFTPDYRHCITVA